MPTRLFKTRVRVEGWLPYNIYMICSKSGNSPHMWVVGMNFTSIEARSSYLGTARTTWQTLRVRILGNKLGRGNLKEECQTGIFAWSSSVIKDMCFSPRCDEHAPCFHVDIRICYEFLFIARRHSTRLFGDDFYFFITCLTSSNHLSSKLVLQNSVA